MEEFPKKFAPVVKAGFNRICRDFSKMIEPLGFSMGGRQVLGAFRRQFGRYHSTAPWWH